MQGPTLSCMSIFDFREGGVPNPCLCSGVNCNFKKHYMKSFSESIMDC